MATLSTLLDHLLVLMLKENHPDVPIQWGNLGHHISIHSEPKSFAFIGKHANMQLNIINHLIKREMVLLHTKKEADRRITNLKQAQECKVHPLIFIGIKTHYDRQVSNRISLSVCECVPGCEYRYQDRGTKVSRRNGAEISCYLIHRIAMIARLSQDFIAFLCNFVQENVAIHAS
jgi:hypothetical protein